MPLRRRFATGGYGYHVLNRAVARDRLFRKPADYQAFEDVLEDAKDFASITGHTVFRVAEVVRLRNSEL